MSDYELVIKWCKYFEEFLEQKLAAQGRGLHENVSSVQSQLPQELVKKLRYIATMRNKLVHEANMDRLPDSAGFLRACQEADGMLRAMLAPAGKSKSGCSMFVLLISIVCWWIAA